MPLSTRLEKLAAYLQSTDTSADAFEHLDALEQATIIVLRWELAKCVREKLHLVWSAESKSGTCPECEGPTALLTQSGTMNVDSEDPQADDLQDGVETGLDVTAHWCPECCVVTAVAVNGNGG